MSRVFASGACHLIFAAALNVAMGKLAWPTTATWTWNYARGDIAWSSMATHTHTYTLYIYTRVRQRQSEGNSQPDAQAKVRSRVAMLNFMPPLLQHAHSHTHTLSLSHTHTRTVGVCHFAGSQAARHFCVHGDCGRSFCGQNGQRFGILVTLCCLCCLSV